VTFSNTWQKTALQQKKLVRSPLLLSSIACNAAGRNLFPAASAAARTDVNAFFFYCVSYDESMNGTSERNKKES
jgi:hypothetical protein